MLRTETRFLFNVTSGVVATATPAVVATIYGVLTGIAVGVCLIVISIGVEKILYASRRGIK